MAAKKYRRTVSMPPAHYRALDEIGRLTGEPKAKIVERLVAADANKRGIQLTSHEEAKGWLRSRGPTSEPATSCELCSVTRSAVGVCPGCNYRMCKRHLETCECL